MTALTTQFGTYPTASPGTLGASIAKLMSSKTGEILVTLSSNVSGQINLWLLRWNGVDAWFPVHPILPPVIQNFPPPNGFPAEATRRPDPPLAGRNRFEFDIKSPGYYLVYAPTAEAADVTSVEMNELFPLSGDFSAGAQVRGATPQYVNPVAANNTGVHAAYAGNAANDFPGPIGTIESWGRTLQVVFAASWDGGDVIITGTNQFGETISETFTAAAGSTVAGGKVFRTVTSIRKTAVGATANTASVGIGTALGVPFQFTRGMEFIAGVSEACSLNTTYFHFVPGTACNGARDYDFIGW